MKKNIKLFFLITLTFSMFFYLNAKEIKVLAIGNSFSICVLKFLPKIVEKQGHKLTLANLYIGGCSLERHVKELKKSQEDSTYCPYKTNYPDCQNNILSQHHKTNLPALIGKEPWDIVVIQQASKKSWDYSTYMPYAEILINYIRQNAPKAEIVIQQTWSYRKENPWFNKSKLNQQEMFDKLNESYQQLAKFGSFRIIPTGTAIQIFRKNYRGEYVNLADYINKRQKIASGEIKIPDYSGDLVGLCRIKKTTKSDTQGKNVLIDCQHLNSDGEYVQACVWYYFLFNDAKNQIKYAPQNMLKADATFLQQCASEAVLTYKQISSTSANK